MFCTMNKLKAMTLVSIIRVYMFDSCGANFNACLWFSEGTLEGGINYQGIQYYTNLINLLKANGEKRYLTITTNDCLFLLPVIAT